MDVGELRQQLLNCADGALEPLMYNSLGGKVDTLSQTDLVKQLEQLAVVVGEEVNLDVRNDALYPTKVEVFANGNTVEEVNKDVRQKVVLSKVDMLHLSHGKCGGLGGANEKQIPKNIVRLAGKLEETLEETPKTVEKCEEPYCQFSMELEDKVSAPRVLGNHMVVAHKRQGQITQQEMTGRKRGRKRIASTQVLGKTSENKNKLITIRQTHYSMTLDTQC